MPRFRLACALDIEHANFVWIMRTKGEKNYATRITSTTIVPYLPVFVDTVHGSVTASSTFFTTLTASTLYSIRAAFCCTAPCILVCVCTVLCAWCCRAGVVPESPR